jgi:eukaryotic-like serine/threonine-protein kinase
MPLAAGTRLGSYEIVAPLGAGGMGEVYRARDPRLGRDVAIKVLSDDLASDAAALARFEREAMSVARLSHPNIVSIFEFAHEAATAFVVTELVEGETLRARLQAGALPPRRAIAYALQIARGIAAAHTRGVVHRDLKPENVMIGRDDHVKILDFGLAKSVEPHADDAMTRGASLATSAGMVLGTFGYMAPEQVRGLAIDHRVDIFAFGAVLYEMLSGERAFKGQTAADTMSAILTKDPPDLDAAGLSIPTALDRIVRRCLEKAPQLRFQSANDLAFAVETLSTSSTSSSPVAEARAATRPARVAWLPWSVATLALLTAGAAWVVRRPPDAPEARWSSFTRITEAAGEETLPALSPDGSTVAYSVRVNGNWDIYAQRVGGRNATPIVNDPQRDERGAAYSPDGSQIAFHESTAVGGVFVAGATGESVRRLTDAGFEPAWSPDGKQIAFATEEIFDPATRQSGSTLLVVDAAGGSPRRVVDGDGVQPSWSPSGERIVYWSNTQGQRDIYTVAAAGGARVPVTQDAALDWSPVWSPDGKYIYFSSDRGGAMNVWRIAVDQSSGRTIGSPEPVTAGVQASASLPRFSRDGSRLVFRSQVRSINPIAIPFDPVTTRAGAPYALETQNNIRVPSDVSADGKQIAFFSIGERQEDIFVGLPGESMRRITDDPPRDRGPVFTPDGRSLIFYSNRDGNWGLWTIRLDGAGLRKIGSGSAVYPLVSPKGDLVVFTAAQGHGLFSTPITSSIDAKPIELPGHSTGTKYFNATGWSRDGARLAGYLTSQEGRPSGAAVYDLASQMMTALTDDPTDAVKWLADNRRVVYFTNKNWSLVVFDTVTRTRTVVDVRLPGPSTDDLFAITPDDRTIYYGAVRAESDIWLVERK